MTQRMRSISERTYDIWRIPNRFTKNPDIVRFPDGRLMLVFCHVEKHWSEEISRITLIESHDDGRTWSNPKVVAEADVRKGEERWVTPRLSRLRDGRLIVICDHDDYAYYHEDQATGNWLWFSDDDGATWSEARNMGFPGIEPDRVVELADGTLITASTLVLRATIKEAMVAMRSHDRGLNWKDYSVVASDRVQNYTEGAIVVLSDKSLACVTRNENHHGYPSFVSFSGDQGLSWSRPDPLPFSGDRPYAKELDDGRVLITYRNRTGNTGTHAWVGDLRKEAVHQIGGMHYEDAWELSRESLVLKDVPNAVTRYLLLPPESFRSRVLLKTSLRVSGPEDQPVATLAVGRMGIALEICSNVLCYRNLRKGDVQLPSDLRHIGDFTKFRQIEVEIECGLLTIRVDGQVVIYNIIRDEWPLDDTWFGRIDGARGEIRWREVIYTVKNETEPDHSWSWESGSGAVPDQYQLDRMLELHSNPPRGDEGRPDHGYSSWVQLPNGEICMVDYSNYGDPYPRSHLYAVCFRPEEV